MKRAGIWKALGDCHLRICPHRSLSDPAIATTHQPDCIRTFDMDFYRCKCDHCDGDQQCLCPDCLIECKFRQHRNVDGTVTLYLLVRNNHVSTPELDGDDLEQDKHHPDGEDGFVLRRRIFWPSEIKRLKEEWKEYAPLLTRDPVVKQVLVPENNPFDSPKFTWS
ncbi:MAG: hypothetical protein Q9222_002780 [Ikaeria aurantiellina]